MVPIIVGAAVSLIGILAVVFVMRRKSVEKRSMYSSRRSQIEHKVRAARQRTLTPHGRAEASVAPLAPPQGAAPTATWGPPASAPQATYEPSAYEPPPAAAPQMDVQAPQAPVASAWDVGPTAPAPQYTGPESVPGQYEVAAPAAPPPSAPPFDPAPNEPVWTPGPAQPAAPVEPAPTQAASTAASGASWSVVSEAKESAETTEDKPKKKGKQAAASGSAWQLASGNAPGLEAEEDIVKAPSPIVAIAQYAVLVVGLIMVLIGVFVMIANSHVT